MDMTDYIDGQLARAREEQRRLEAARTALAINGRAASHVGDSTPVVLSGGGKKRTPEQRARMGAAQRARFARAREVREQARRNVRASAARMAPFGVGPA